MGFEVSGTGVVAGISRRAAERLRAGHLWVYRSDVERLQPAELAGGALVGVADGRGVPLGTALYSDASEIALRMVSRRVGVGRAEYLGEVRERLQAAIRLREQVAAEAFRGLAPAMRRERRMRQRTRRTLAGWSSPRRTSCRGSSPTATASWWWCNC